MNNEYTICATYSATCSATIELPVGKCWKDVKSWYVKWAEIHIEFKDGSQVSIDISDTIGEAEMDTKRPTYVEVQENQDGFANEIDSQ